MTAQSDGKPKRLLVCVNPVGGANKPCCGGDRGSETLARTIEAGLRKRRIACTVERIHCLNKCLQGPSMRLAPGGDFFLAMGAADIPALLDRLETECGTAPEAAAAADPPDSLAGLYPGA